MWGTIFASKLSGSPTRQCSQDSAVVAHRPSPFLCCVFCAGVLLLNGTHVGLNAVFFRFIFPFCFVFCSLSARHRVKLFMTSRTTLPRHIEFVLMTQQSWRRTRHGSDHKKTFNHPNLIYRSCVGVVIEVDPNGIKGSFHGFSSLVRIDLLWRDCASQFTRVLQSTKCISTGSIQVLLFVGVKSEVSDSWSAITVPTLRVLSRAHASGSIVAAAVFFAVVLNSFCAPLLFSRCFLCSWRVKGASVVWIFSCAFVKIWVGFFVFVF